MAGELTDVGENLALDFLSGNAAVITGPLKARLMSAMGTDSAAGTEVTGGSYASQTITFGAAAAGANENTNALTFAGMPATNVAGMEIWDSSGTPKRLWSIVRVGGTVAISAGASVTVAIGDVDLSIA